MVTTEQLYQKFLQHSKICTDTRKITNGCLFFCLKGDNFNGNVFSGEAVHNGAAFAIVDEPEYAVGAQFLLVENVLEALQALASLHRSTLRIPIVALTGSNGKTTTKELIRSVLTEKFETYATFGNLNNHIGVPLSLLELTSKHELAIIEMGANHQGEIAALCEIAKPTHGVITNIGLAHLEGFGSAEGVKKGKGELYQWLRVNNGAAFINIDSPALTGLAEEIGLTNVIKYGSTTGTTIQGVLESAKPFLKMRIFNPHFENEVMLKITGAYNFENVLCAFSVGLYFGLSPDEIAHGLEHYTPANNRSQIVDTAKNRVICDFYNANPSSMLVALHNLKGQPDQTRIAILGDMFELGEMSEEQHKAVSSAAANAQLSKVILIGQHFKDVAEPGIFAFTSVEEAEAYLKENRPERAMILLKGSRGMALERLMPLL